MLVALQQNQIFGRKSKFAHTLTESARGRATFIMGFNASSALWLEELRSGTNAFGLYLPDDAIVAVREWLDTLKFLKNAQVKTVSSALFSLFVCF